MRLIDSFLNQLIDTNLLKIKLKASHTQRPQFGKVRKETPGCQLCSAHLVLDPLSLRGFLPPFPIPSQWTVPLIFSLNPRGPFPPFLAKFPSPSPPVNTCPQSQLKLCCKVSKSHISFLCAKEFIKIYPAQKFWSVFNCVNLAMSQVYLTPPHFESCQGCEKKVWQQLHYRIGRL